MRMLSNRSATTLLLASLVFAAGLGAQNPLRPTAADSVFARARQLVANGNGAAGRVLVDSVVTVTEPDTPLYPEALYWRAALAASSGDAERDYRRIVVEYPLSPRTGDALIQLAQLEVARGDRASAVNHLERFLLENPKHAERARAELLIVKLAFELNDLQRGCVFLRRTLRDVPESAVETRNQLEYYTPRCVGVDTNRVTQRAGVAATADSVTPKRDTVQAISPPKGKYTVQVGAYGTRAEAERATKRLKARGFDVRLVGTAKPFRVRIGHYETRAAANAALKTLRAQKIDGYVTESGDDDK